MVFPLDPGAYRYRPLRLPLKAEDPLMRGWDVAALQSMLPAKLVRDGIYGQKTADAVGTYQTRKSMEAIDKIAGIATQRSLLLGLASLARNTHKLPIGLPKGHIEKECGYQVGNHTSPYTDGSRDLGPVQMNSRYWKIEIAYDAPVAINGLCEQLRRKFDTYRSLDEVSEQRCWELAAGSWNRPAWTDALARGETIPDDDLEWIEGYISAVCAYTTFD